MRVYRMYLIPCELMTLQKSKHAVHLAKEAWNKVSAKTIRNCFYNNVFTKINDEHKHSLLDKLVDLWKKCMNIGFIWTHVSKLLSFPLKRRSIIRFWILKYLNRLTFMVSKKRTVRDLHQIKKLWKFLVFSENQFKHRADKNGVGQHYSYGGMIIKLLDKEIKRHPLILFFNKVSTRLILISIFQVQVCILKFIH